MSAILASYFIPGFNVAFVFSLILTIVLTWLVIPYGKRRPKGKPVSWGEAAAAGVYIFLVLFLAYGVVPHQWLAHADNELAWRKDKILVGPQVGDQGLLEYLPFTITAEVIRDIVAVTIYVVFLGMQIFMWVRWQNRDKLKPGAEVAPTSTYGRPLVRKA
ncbi:MAG TPA: hypothetical protein VF855_04110 [Acidimicrobiales bacterium]